MKGSASQVGQLVSILAWSGNTNGTHPVEVEMSQLVDKLLLVLWFEASRVMDDIVIGWRHGSSSNRLADTKELITFWTGDIRIHNGSRKWISELGRGQFTQKSSIDPFRNDAKGELDSLITSHVFQNFGNSFNFDIIDMTDHSITNSVPVKDDGCGKHSIHFSILFECS